MSAGPTSPMKPTVFKLENFGGITSEAGGPLKQMSDIIVPHGMDLNTEPSENQISTTSSENNTELP